MRMSWGWLTWVIVSAVACAPETRLLGDGPAGAASEGGDTGAAGSSVLPRGGSAQQAGSGGTAPVAMGGEPGNQGGQGSSPGCFSPGDHPELAYEVGGPPGCSCEKDAAECVRTQYQGRPWDIALMCVDGRWQGVEDGPCDGGATCTIDGTEYPSGAWVPSPFDSCNRCRCDHGDVGGCTSGQCTPHSCPDGTFQAKRCTSCGPADGCDAWEYGCFSDPACADGICSTMQCG